MISNCAVRPGAVEHHRGLQLSKKRPSPRVSSILRSPNSQDVFPASTKAKTAPSPKGVDWLGGSAPNVTTVVRRVIVRFAICPTCLKAAIWSAKCVVLAEPAGASTNDPARALVATSSSTSTSSASATLAKVVSDALTMPRSIRDSIARDTPLARESAELEYRRARRRSRMLSPTRLARALIGPFSAGRLAAAPGGIAGGCDVGNGEGRRARAMGTDASRSCCDLTHRRRSRLPPETGRLPLNQKNDEAMQAAGETPARSRLRLFQHFAFLAFTRGSVPITWPPPLVKQTPSAHWYFGSFSTSAGASPISQRSLGKSNSA